jgi:DNA-binding beta-propeller fold protein YncE
MLKLCALLGSVLALCLVGTATASASSTPFTMAQAAGEGTCFTQAQPGDSDDPPKCDAGKSLINATAVAVSPDGKQVYVGAAGGGEEREYRLLEGARGGIAEFTRAGSGALAQKGCVTNDSGNGIPNSHGACSQGIGLMSVEGMAFTSDGTSLFAVSRARSSLLGFTRAADTGLLSQFACVAAFQLGRCGPAYSILRASAVAVSPDDKNVYVGSSAQYSEDLQTDAVATFSRDGSTGVLTETGCVSETGSDGQCDTAGGIAGVDGLAVSPDGRDLYTISDGAIASFRRDTATGALMKNGCVTDRPKTSCSRVTASGRPTDLAISPDGKNVYVTSQSDPAVLTYGRDAATGKLSYQGCNATPATPDPGDEGDDTEEAADEPTCAPVKGLGGARTLAISPDGKSVLVGGDSADYGATLTTLTRDASNGELTAAGCVSSDETAEQLGCATANDLQAPVAVAISPDGQSAYVADVGANAVFSFDVAATVSRRVARLDRHGRARLTVSCPAAKSGGCRGSVRLARAGAHGRKPLSRPRRFALRPGATGSALLRVHRARGTIVAVITDATGHVRPVTRRVTLRR